MLVKQGAEAELRRTEFLGRPAIEKYRRAKAYRLDVLDDELRRSRIRHETRLMAEARAAGVAVPILYDINLVENKIIMEFVDGPTWLTPGTKMLFVAAGFSQLRVSVDSTIGL